MATITGFKCIDEESYPVLSDPHGNNIAFRCSGCGGPVLAVMLDHRRGESSSNPSECRACGCRFWLELDERKELLTLHRMR